MECGNCKQKGHKRKDCENDPVCYECLQPGHKRGSMACPAFHAASVMSEVSKEVNEQVNDDDELYETDKGGEDEVESGESDSGGESAENDSGEDDDRKSDKETHAIEQAAEPKSQER